VAYAKPTGIADIPFASENIVTHIKSIQATDGVSFCNPSEIFAKLFAVIQQDNAINKKIISCEWLHLIRFSYQVNH
jgi:hypothetical protein